MTIFTRQHTPFGLIEVSNFNKRRYNDANTKPHYNRHIINNTIYQIAKTQYCGIAHCT